MASSFSEENLEHIIAHARKLWSGRNQISDLPESETDEEGTDDEDLRPNLPDPPFTVRDRAHLLELLDAGLASPCAQDTDED